MPTSSLAFRRFFCCAIGGASPSTNNTKRNLVFLGSPKVAASVLDALFNASEAQDSIFKLAAIVTQPPSGRDRGRKLMPSPVAHHAIQRGYPEDLIFTPGKAGEEPFLADLRALNPELCITAAYGNILPSKFLQIPCYGTVNIHPSLLPLYRGAAPVQRALQDGVTETGVSLAYTVRALDAGPIIACEKVELDDSIKAPELLNVLFGLGSELLIRELPSLFDGSARLKAQPQDDSKATFAPKLSSEESWLSFDQEARSIHNKVRAFAGWPGTRARVQVIDDSGHHSLLEIKIITSRVGRKIEKLSDGKEIIFISGALVFPCAGESWLEVLELQLPGKKVMTARDFWNGLRGQKLQKLP
ncbi:uncharacterized protein A4U43_C05F8400 [Asparagus officinalis]|uniref:Methionyl-tRNA formyltransferase, mitochondrial n=1 Tax=Asparagus officinalis TaxID=4686 RepID=A0A5P1EQT8_ASPOF|nr:uncharacterized protein LOC109842735 [Asparagus officinalis]XP_020267196.1 uncharacterized protein LOC109842735 [Asparagus officinalis]ONK68174.1 uncharacterized protein A4U43_C05F8400 [Asparagus officinalis]